MGTEPTASFSKVSAMSDITQPSEPTLAIASDRNADGEITFLDAEASGEALQQRWLTVDGRVVVDVEDMA